MDEKHQIETADDIQHALASMMAVEPSPDFAARVRQRIAAGADARKSWSLHVVLPALATAAVVVLGVVLIFAGTRRIEPERMMPGATRVSQPEPVVSRPSQPAAVVAVQPEERPTVLVPKNEIVAIQQLLSAARAGRFEFELVPAGLPVADELSAPAPISLPPIEMMPIGASGSFE